MNLRTASITVAAPRDAVFHFLADIENLPKWATGYCESLELRQGSWWAYTSQGEMLVELESNAACGVIDLRAGPAPDRLQLLPLRVLPPTPGGTTVTCTFLQPPGLPAELYEARFRSLLVGLEGLIRRFGGGELHAPESPAQLATLGVN